MSAHSFYGGGGGYGDPRAPPPGGPGAGYPAAGYPPPGGPPPAGYPSVAGYPPPSQPPPSGYPPQHGAPGYGGYPPQQGPGGYGAPPSAFSAPPGPPPPQQFAQQGPGFGGGGYPPAPQGYGPPSGGPPQGYNAPPQGYGAPPQGYGAPFAGPGGPQGGGYHQGYPSAPSQQPPAGVFTFMGVPVPPPPPHQPLPPPSGVDVSGKVERIYRAMKGFGTDDKTLIHELCTMHDPFEIDAVRNGYKSYKGKDLMKAVEGDVSGWYEAVLRWQVYGPVMGDVIHLHRAMKGAGTDEPVLTEILIGRSNADIHLLKSAYQATFSKSLDQAVAGELSFKTKRLFAQALAGLRSESAPVNPQQVEEDVRRIYTAMRGAGTDEDAITSILMVRNDAQLVAIAQRYRQAHSKSLSAALSGDFSGHMREAILYLVSGAEDPAGVQGFGVQRDANLIFEACQGGGTKDRALVRRVCRASWNRPRFQAVKQAYRQLHKQELVTRVERETTGNYEKSLVTVIKTA